MDISKSPKFSTVASADKARWLHIKFSDGSLAYDQDKDGKLDKSKPLRIKLLGSDSSEYKAAKRKVANKFAHIRRSRRGMEPTYDDQVEGQLTLDASVSIEFENIELNGSPVTSERAKELYEAVPDVYEQVQAFVGDRTAFMPGLKAV